MNFGTYGPFAIDELTKNGFADFWKNANRQKKGLSEAIGVYILVEESSKGVLKPLYVGKTDNGFKTRFGQHLKGGSFDSASHDSSGSLSFFLIARITSTGKLKRVTAKMKEMRGLKSIDRLEFFLIGSCLTQNPDLKNKQQKSFHSLFHVPGYINSKPKDYDTAARRLARMLAVR